MNSLNLSNGVLLAEVSYGKFDADVPTVEEIRRALSEERVSQTQVAHLTSQYSVAHHRANTASGFSATLFRTAGSTDATGLTLAIRGTEPGLLGTGVDLVQADLQGIVVDGVAIFQIVDLYNYWNQLTAAAGSTVRLARVANTDDPNATGVFATVAGVSPGGAASISYRRIEFFDQASAGLGVVSGPVSGVTVTGHSLGGHLATAFQRLFPLVVGEVYTVNGAGTRETDIASRFFDALAGQFTSFDPTKVTGIFGSAGPNVVAGELVYTQIGDRGELFTESIMDVGGHGNKQMTDSAAVYDLFTRMDNGLRSGSVAALSAALLDTFKAADASPAATLESLVDSLGELFVTGYVPFAPGEIGDRNALHTKIADVREALPDGGLTVVPLTGKSAAELVALANQDIAYRYALRELNGFAVLGADYGLPNLSGALDPFDEATGKGMTPEWLEGRARFLGAKIPYNIADGSSGDAALGARFEDGATGLNLGPVTNLVPRYRFAADGEGDTLTGSPKDDRLFGGTGNDTLNGGAGNDYLEAGGGDDLLAGGAGTNQLRGGTGADRYLVTSGEGFQVVRDADGAGSIVVNGMAVAGGEQLGGNTFADAATGLTLTLVGNPHARGSLLVGDSVRIENFHSGDLGIVLDGVADPGLPDAAYLYSRFPFADNAADEEAGDPALQYGSDDNDVFRVGAFDPFSDDPDLQLHLDDGRFRGKAGDDVFHGSYHYADRFLGDAGNDVLFGGDLGAGLVPAGDTGDGDVLVGGAGADMLTGGRGDDLLYGDFISSPVISATSLLLDEFFAQASVAHPGFIEAHYMSANMPEFFLPVEADDAVLAALGYALGLAGNDVPEDLYDDIVEGGAGNDSIIGGYGSDALSGGDGDDVIDGDTPNPLSASIPDEYLALFGRPGDDFLDGGAGNDELRDTQGGNDALYGGDGDDVLTNVDPGDDVGGPVAYSNYLDGGAGDDVIDTSNDSRGGYDIVVGGTGNDVVTFWGQSGFVDGGDGDDRIELTGGPDQDDVGAGSASALVVLGGAGNDDISVTGMATIDAGSGDDLVTVIGGTGHIAGGAGNDTVFLLVPGDLVVDLSGGPEEVDELVFLATPAGPGGPFAPVVTFAGLAPRLSGNDVVLDLLYDSPGGQISSGTVTLPDWTLGSSHRPDVIRVEGGTQWSPADLATLLGFADPLPPDDNPDPDPPPNPDPSGTPVSGGGSTALAPVVSAALDAELVLEVAPQLASPDVPLSSGVDSGVLPVGGDDAAPADALHDYLERFDNVPRFDFDAVVHAMQQPSNDAPMAPQVQADFTFRWSALHDYLDLLNATSSSAEKFADGAAWFPVPRLVSDSMLGTTISFDGRRQPGIVISDGNIPSFRTLQGLQEGMSLLG